MTFGPHISSFEAGCASIKVRSCAGVSFRPCAGQFQTKPTMTDNDMRRILGAKPMKFQLRGHTKMTDEQEKELRRRFFKGGESKDKLKAEYGISESTFNRKTCGGANWGKFS